MRGKHINNVYLIDGTELNSKDLTNDQLLLVETFENRKLYNDFRNIILEQEGDDIECAIEIRIPEMVFESNLSVLQRII
jgi:hypothetical protein